MNMSPSREIWRHLWFPMFGPPGWGAIRHSLQGLEGCFVADTRGSQFVALAKARGLSFFSGNPLRSGLKGNDNDIHCFGRVLHVQRHLFFLHACFHTARLAEHAIGTGGGLTRRAAGVHEGGRVCFRGLVPSGVLQATQVRGTRLHGTTPFHGLRVKLQAPPIQTNGEADSLPTRDVFHRDKESLGAPQANATCREKTDTS